VFDRHVVKLSGVASEGAALVYQSYAVREAAGILGFGSVVRTAVPVHYSCGGTDFPLRGDVREIGGNP
jgi:hypothetical protein